LHEVVLEPACTNADYEAAFRAAAEQLRRSYPTLSRLAFGDLFLEDVRAYREQLLASVGLAAHFPLWGLETRALADRFVALGYRARLVCVDTTQLGRDFVGRLFDESLLGELPASVDPCGERGEFHTFVSDGPIFGAPVPYVTGEVVMREERFAYCDLVGLAPADHRPELASIHPPSPPLA
jgi:diphthamide synthase (EF-2-diphthine--ammonia ligase)